MQGVTMKLRKIRFKDHPVLKDLQVSFEDENGKALSTVVLIGNNGSGKTSILRGIFDGFDIVKAYKKNSFMSTELESVLELTLGRGEFEKKSQDTNLPRQNFISLGVRNDTIICDETDEASGNHYKIVFMPAEINFSLADKIDTRAKIPNQFLSVINQTITKNISSFIATKVETAVFENDDLIPKDSIKKVCAEINAVFACMDLDVELIGLSKDEKKQPLFQNKNGETFFIESLSSGEKQLFMRALSLKFLDINDSIILIDEPEISLHPAWQQKIIKLYESIGRNNQLIIATHSPHVVGDIKKEQLRILSREDGTVRVVPVEEVENTYGQTTESILTQVMGLETVRNEALQAKLLKIQKLLRANDALKNDELKKLLADVAEHLDDADVEMALINAQIRRMQMRGAKDNVENQ